MTTEDRPTSLGRGPTWPEVGFQGEPWRVEAGPSVRSQGPGAALPDTSAGPWGTLSTSGRSGTSANEGRGLGSI